MPKRETAVSKTISYETEPCLHCESEVVTSDVPNDAPIDDENGGAVVVGEDVSISRTKPSARVKASEVGSHFVVHTICAACMENIYGYNGGVNSDSSLRITGSYSGKLPISYKSLFAVLAIGWFLGAVHVIAAV